MGDNTGDRVHNIVLGDDAAANTIWVLGRLGQVRMSDRKLLQILIRLPLNNPLS